MLSHSYGLLACSALFLLALTSCATVSTEREISDFETAAADEPFPEYSGERRRVQVIRFGIPRDIAEQYPELTDKRVGWGLNNRMLEGLYATGRFEFIEEKQEILDRMTEQWKLSMSGLVAEDTEVEAGNLRAPEYLVYAEVYDFAVSYSEDLVGIAMRKKNTTVLGIQIRIVEVESGEYVVASGAGDASSSALAAWVNPDLSFDQTTVGIATQRAVNVALRNLLVRMDAQS